MKHLLIILLAFIFLQNCSRKKSITELYDNKSYYEIIENLNGNDTLSYNNSLLLYKSYIQIFDKAFNWSGPVDVLEILNYKKIYLISQNC